MRVDAAFLDLLKQHFLPRTGDGTIGGTLRPSSDLAYDLGAPSRRFDAIYARNVVADNVSSGLASSSASNADTVDGFHAYAAPTASSLLALDASLVFPTSVYASALLLDGSRALAGSLSVNSGVTIDGVDISAHAADAAKHHNSGMSADDHTQYVHTTTARTITAVHTFSPGSDTAPFSLGAHAQGQTVVGLKADQLNKSVLAGSGLAGGGALTAGVTLSVQLQSTSGLVVDGTGLALADTVAGSGLAIASKVLSVGAGTLITVGADTVGVSNGTAQYQVPVTGASPYAPAYTSLSSMAGSGLTFSAGEFAVNAGMLLSIASDAIGLSNGSAQYQVISTGASPFAPAYTAMSTFAGDGLDFSSGQFLVGAGTLVTVSSNAVGLSSGSAQYQVISTGASPYAPAYTALSAFAGDGLEFTSGAFRAKANTLISVSSSGISLASGSAQYQVPVTAASPYTPSWTGLSAFAGDGLTFTGGAYAVGAGTLITVGADAVSLSSGSAQHQVPLTGASPYTPAWTAVSTLAGDGISFSGGYFNVELSTTSGLELTGSTPAKTLQLADSVAGSGLTISNKALNVGAGTLITVDADAVSLSSGTAQYQVPMTGASPYAPAWTALSSLAGSGLVFNSGAFAVGAGNGITVNTDDVAVRLQSTSGLTADSSGLAVADALAGSGLAIASKVLSVGAGTLITISADAVSLASGTAQYQVPVTGGSPYTPAYTALSSFAGDGLLFSSGCFQVSLSGASGLELTGSTPGKTLQLANSVAGAGLTITNKVLDVGAGTLISVNADAVSVANGSDAYQVIMSAPSTYTPTWTSLTAMAGAGLVYSAGAFAVGAGSGITVNADDVAVKLQTTSGLTVDSSGLAVADTLAGNGLAIASKVLSVGAGTLITISADQVGLSNGTAQYQVPVTGANPYTPAWTALSTFAGDGLSFDASGYFNVELSTTSGLELTGSTPAKTLQLADSVAGSGLTISSKVLNVGAGTLISVGADAVSVASGSAEYQVVMSAPSTYLPTWTCLSSMAGSGLTFSAGAFAVGAGNGITVNADDVAVKLQTTSGLAVDSSGLAVADTIAGSGLAIASKVLSVGAGTLITVSADQVGVSNGSAQYQMPVTGASPYTPSWTALSTFAGDGLNFDASGYFNIELSAASGLELSGATPAKTLQLADSIAGSGLTISSKVLNVGAGTLISVNADAVSVANGPAAYQVIMSAPSTCTPTWTALSGFAGPGIGWDSGSGCFKIDAGALITVGADSISVSNGSAQYQVPVTGASPYTPSWTALSGFAGAGLTFSGGVFAVGAGSGLTVNADDVALTTPGTLTVSTTNSAAGSHTHAVTSSSNPGAAASILASASDGLLTLAKLTVDNIVLDGNTASTSTGSLLLAPAGAKVGINQASPTYALDVTGDGRFTTNLLVGSGLTVSGTGTIVQDLQVGSGLGTLFVDVSQNNVGIGCAPDPQFSLDVAGNLRAQGWIVGRHAVQLSGAAMICHYDGPRPYETNYTGDTTGHMGQIGTVVGGAIFIPGVFGKGIQAADAVTNLVTNPSAETNTTGWTSLGYGTITQSAAYAKYGSYSFASASDSGESYGIFKYDYASLPVGTYTFSAHVYAPSGQAETLTDLRIYMQDGSYNNLAIGTTTTTTDEWVRLYVTYTNPSIQDVKLLVRATWSGTAGGSVVYMDAAQFGASAYPSPYCDGSLGSGHSWSGTAHASASSRTAGYVTYSAAGAAKTNKGTVMFHYIPTADNTNTNNMGLFTIGSTTSGSGNPGSLQIFKYGSTGGYYIRVRDNSAWAQLVKTGLTINPGDDVFIACTWLNNSTVTGKIYINGTLAYSGATALGTMPTTWYSDTLWVGWGYTGYAANGVIDDLVILDRAATDAEIQAVVESDAPVFAETSNWQWKAANSLLWVDSEGMWMKDTNGKAVIGAFGATGTKSWGGVAMSQGDYVVGDATTGRVMHWKAADQKLVIGKESVDHILMDGTAISLKAGASTYLKLNSDGTGYFANSSITWDAAGNLTVAGSATIAGWSVQSAYLAKDTGTNNTSSGMAPSDYPFYAGSTYANRAAAPFRVTPAGALTATSGTIGGWSLSPTSLTADSGAVGLSSAATGGADIRIWAGNATPGSAPFQVDETGYLLASSASITGAIDANSGYLGSLTVDGALTVGTGGVIKSGATGYGAGTGWWMEYNAGTPRFYIGAAAGNQLTWNGTTLSIAGTIDADAGYLGTMTVDGALTVGTGGSIKSGATGYGVGTGFWLDYNSGTPRFYIGTESGDSLKWSGSSLDITGNITADSGAIGGWAISTSYLAKDTGTDNTSAGLAPGDYPFYAGATYANRANAPFKVTPAGAVTAASGTIAGWALNTSYFAKDTGTNNTSSGMAPLDYPFYAGGTYANRAAAPFRVSPAGTLTAADASITGTIDANAGYLGSLTVDGALSLSASGVLKSGATAYETGTGFWMEYNGGTPRFFIGNASGNKLTWNGTTLSITGTVDADAGYLGSLTVDGTLAVSTGGVIKSGATAYGTGTGFWMEYNGGTPRFYIGAQSGDSLKWTGSALDIVGNITADSGSIGGWTINTSYLAKDTGTDDTSSGMAPGDYSFYAGATYANRASAPFRVTPAGAVTAASGTIAGWTLASAYFAKDTGTDNTSSGMAPTDYPFYAGGTYANRASTPFRVTPAGALTATNASITGTIDANAGYLGSLTVDGTLSLSTGGVIKSGATAYETGTGIWIEHNSGTPRFFIGTAPGNKLTWNGTTLSIAGTVDADAGCLGSLTVDGTLAVSTGGVIKSGATDYGAGTGWWMDYNAGTPRFYVGTQSGDSLKWTGSSLDITGNITADSGAIGGWTINASYLAKDTGTDNTSSGMAPGDYPFYAGSTYANRAAAPFRVTPAGAVSATSGVIAGWTLATSYLVKDTGTDNASSGLAPADYPMYAGAIYTNRAAAPFRVTPAGALTATNANITGTIDANAGYLGSLTVDGTLSLSTGGVIKSGAAAYNTGTGFWIEYNAGAPRFFIGNDSGNKLTWDGSALSITGTVDANAGYLGTLTVDGALTLSTGGVIKSGATAYGTGTGFWMEYNGGAPRFYIGTESGDSLKWAGAALDITGNITADSGSIGGWTINASYLAKDTGTDSTSAGMAPGDYPFYAGATYANRSAAPFRVTPAGLVTATSGLIGGWTLSSTALTCDSGAVGLSSAATGGTDYRIWAGNASPASAPFRVDETGALVASSANIAGAVDANSGTIGALTVDGTLSVGTGGAVKAGATAYDTGTGFWMEYNGGAPRFFIGSSSGNKLTWNGSALAVTGAVTATSGSLSGLTVSGALTVGTGGSIGSGATDYSTGTGWWMEYNAGTPRLRVGNPSGSNMTWDGSALSVTGAVTATSGTLQSLAVSGTLNMSTGGIIKSGALTAPDNGTGIWLDYNSGAPRFFAGSSSGSKLYWDGSNLLIKGLVVMQAGGGGGFEEYFQGPLSEVDSRWTKYSGSGETSLLTDGSAGGQAYSIGNNSGNDEARIHYGYSIPFDPGKLYRMFIRVRRTAGTGTIYAGVAGRNAADDQWVNRTGSNSLSAQHYIVTANTAPGSSWTEYVGYFKGTSASGSGTACPDPSAPGALYTTVRYIRPIVIANYSGAAGTTDIDEIRIDVMPDTSDSPWRSGSDATYIDGGRLYTGTVTADKITTGTLGVSKAITVGTAANSKGRLVLATDASNNATLKGIYRDGSGVDADQAYFGSDGKIYGGAGYVWIDSNGLSIKSDAVLQPSHKLKFYEGSSIPVGTIAGVSGTTYSMELRNDNSDTRDRSIFLYAAKSGSSSVSITLGATATGCITHSANDSHYFSSGGLYVGSYGSIPTVPTGEIWWGGPLKSGSDITFGTTSAERMRLTTGGQLLLGTAAANTMTTIGLTINQQANDNEVLSVKSSDVAHGMTSSANATETSTYGYMRKAVAANGGLLLAGLTAGTGGMYLGGYHVTDDTGKSSSASGAVNIQGGLKASGAAAIGSLGSNANLLTVQNWTATKFILDADGDSHQDVGTAWTNFDDFDDPALLTDLSLAVSREGDPIRDEFGDFIKYNPDALARAKLVTFNPDGRNFVNMSRLAMLLTGAVRQLASRMERYERALLEAGIDPKMLEA